MRRITAGINSSSASGLCAASMAPPFWSVLKCAADELPDLHDRHQQQLSPTALWSPAWAISIATLALQVLISAILHPPPSSSRISPQILLSVFARAASTTVSNIATAIAQIMGRGGSVFESLLLLQRHHLPQHRKPSSRTRMHWLHPRISIACKLRLCTYNKCARMRGIFIKC
jgi:hypothetical protein